MNMVYLCEFCDIYFKNKEACLEHENECCKNPKNEECGSCDWFDGHISCMNPKINRMTDECSSCEYWCNAKTKGE